MVGLLLEVMAIMQVIAEARLEVRLDTVKVPEVEHKVVK